jgi:tetratricopeptide (TPR) repeat protein
MKIRYLLPLLIFIAGLSYSQSDPAGYDKALEWYNKKHYVKAVEILKEYMDDFPLDMRAPELLEKMYDKYTEFQIVYLQGKELYNKKLYLKTIEAFSNALKVGFSDKLQFYLTECIRTVFELENGFLPSAVNETAGSMTISWESGLLTNALVVLVKSENLPLLNMIHYLNENKIPIARLEKYFTQGNIFKSFTVNGTSVTVSKNQPADSFLVIVYPKTAEDVRSQPIIRLVVAKEPSIQNKFLMLEPIGELPILPLYTNIHIIIPGQPEQTNTNTISILTKYSNLITNMMQGIGSNTNAQTAGISCTDGGGFPWWWLLILLLIILVVLIGMTLREKRRRELARKMEQWNLENDYDLTETDAGKKTNVSKKKAAPPKKKLSTVKPEPKTEKKVPSGAGKAAPSKKKPIPKAVKDSKPKPKAVKNPPIKPKAGKGAKKPKGGGGKKLPAIIVLLLSGIIAVSAQEFSDAPGWKEYAQKSLGPAIWGYYTDNTGITNLPQSYYDDILNFYSFEKSGHLPQYYLKTLEFLRDTSKYLRNISSVYFSNFDYENYALTCFMVYYIDKDYSFFSQSIAELKKAKTEAIADKILQKSVEYEKNGLFLGAIIRITGYMSLSANIQPEIFQRLNDLYAKNKAKITQYEYISAAARINKTLTDSEIPAVKKDVLCLREAFEYEAMFGPMEIFTQVKKDAIEFLRLNYQILLYNGLLTEGYACYLDNRLAPAKECYELAWHIAPKKELLPSIGSNIAMIKGAMGGKGVQITITNVPIP